MLIMRKYTNVSSQTAPQEYKLHLCIQMWVRQFSIQYAFLHMKALCLSVCRSNIYGTSLFPLTIPANKYQSINGAAMTVVPCSSVHLSHSHFLQRRWDGPSHYLLGNPGQAYNKPFNSGLLDSLSMLTCYSGCFLGHDFTNPIFS